MNPYEPILTIAVPLVFYVVTSIIGYKLLIKSFRDQVQIAMDHFSDFITGIFNTRRATVAGLESGQVRGDNAMMEKMAGDILNGPKLTAMKAAAKMGLGVDIDSYIEEDGAIKTLDNIQALANMIGFDLGSLMKEGVGGMNLSVGHEANQNNPYLP